MNPARRIAGFTHSADLDPTVVCSGGSAGFAHDIPRLMWGELGGTVKTDFWLHVFPFHVASAASIFFISSA